MDETLTRIGRNMKVERTRRGWTQGDLSERTGLARHSINRYEMGYTNMKLDALMKIAEAFDLTLEALVYQES